VANGQCSNFISSICCGLVVNLYNKLYRKPTTIEVHVSDNAASKSQPQLQTNRATLWTRLMCYKES